MTKLELKKEIVKKYWDLFPFQTERLPDYIEEELVEVGAYRKTTSRSNMLTAMNNTFFQMRDGTDNRWINRGH